MKSDGILTTLLVVLVLVVVGSVGYLISTTKSGSSSGSGGSGGPSTLGDQVGGVVDAIYGLVDKVNTRKGS